MWSFYYDIALTLLTFVLMGYLSYVAMNNRRAGNDDSDDGGLELDRSPKIDLPPGVIWPSDAPQKVREKEEILI